MNVVQRIRPLGRRGALLAVLLVCSALLGGFARAPHASLAFLATAPLLPSGSATGSGSAGTISGPPASIGIALNGARPNTVYAVYSCIPMLPGTFDCVGRNNPPALQQVTVYPKALAPIGVTLAQQDTLATDANGNASHGTNLQSVLYPDTPASIYNVVQLVDLADPTDSYTAVTLQTPVPPVAGGANNVPAVGITLLLGQPVYVLAAYPGYAFPVAITTLSGAPFLSYYTLPYGAAGGFPVGFNQGLCPNGHAPTAYPQPNGTIFFSC